MRLNEPADLLAVTDTKSEDGRFFPQCRSIACARNCNLFSLAVKQRSASSSNGWAIPSFDPSKPQIVSRALLEEARDPPRLKSFVFDRSGAAIRQQAANN